MATKPGLGRGLDSLFPTDFSKDAVLAGRREGVNDIAIDLIRPKKDQPRTVFDQELIEQLSYSIQAHGLLQPLIVVQKEGQYILVAGERRLRAAKLAKLTHVPVIVRTATDLEQLEIALVENIQRKDLSPLEQAHSIQKLRDEFSQSYDDIAKRLGKSSAAITNTARLLKLAAPYQQALVDELLSEGHARMLLALDFDPEAQQSLFSNIIKYHWSVRKAELFVQDHKESKGVYTSRMKKAFEQKFPAAERLAQKLSVTVVVTKTARGGNLTIKFKDEEELERIMSIIG